MRDQEPTAGPEQESPAEPADPAGEESAAQAQTDMRPPAYLADDVARFSHYFGKPVAVQLREPYVGIESTYDDADGRMRAITSNGCGWPRLAQQPNAEGKMGLELTTVFFGMLRATEDGRALIIERSTPILGSRTNVTVNPDVIHSVTMVTKPAEPPQEGRIIRPVN